MSVLGRLNEQGIRTIEVLFTPDRSDSIRITIRQKVLSVRMASVGESLQKCCSFLDEIFTFLLIDG